MPIYLSLPGHATKEPWRHGLLVYERPVPLVNNPDDNHDQNVSGRHGQSNDDSNNSTAVNVTIGGDSASSAQQQQQPLRPEMRHDTTMSRSHSSLEDHHPSSSSTVGTTPHQQTATATNSNQNDTTKKSKTTPIRRIRHAEVVLVDQCVIAHGRYWLRLKWPGEQEKHGGYVALCRVEDVGVPFNKSSVAGDGDDSVSGTNGSGDKNEGGGGGDDNTNNGAGVNVTSTFQAMGAASSIATPTPLLCSQTNTHYPTSAAMKLLPSYDDGLNNDDSSGGDNNDEILVSLETGEPVFCRICREGLHDVNTDYLETTAPPQQQQSSRAGHNNAGGDDVDEGSRERDVVDTSAAAVAAAAAGGEATATTTRNDSEEGRNDTVGRSSLSSERSLSPIPSPGGAMNTTTNNINIDIPSITRFHPSADNPLLAPCKCTGSMAFVHYLCVEQWRCRSRHPGAKNGLNCETCGSEYTLPPPPSRPNRNPAGVEGGMMVGDDDWLDAMPPHVLAALRRPHPWWQLGAAVVRRRWLRPIVPVLASPLVALYCKARRTLKKRGVSRRRWACSLCRRRARWKCVRCLRSYYCSRQCQNVSWHIVHKHVCYKPVRFWSSVVVYTLGILMLVPGIIKNFPIYDTSATLLPINFIAMGNIAGGAASTLKRSAGIDIRGRILEISVIICTLFLTAVTTGLVRGYFGDSSQCWGVLASSTESTTQGPFIDSFSNKAFAAFLQYAQLYYKKWDFLCARTAFISRKFLCTPTEDGNMDYATIGCSPPVRSINPQFHLEEENCQADVGMVVGIWVAACLVLCLEHIYREYRVRRRAAVHRGRRRPHQD